MDIFVEFFIESDLWLLGIFTTVIAFLLPARKDQMRRNIIVALMWLVGYIVAEIVMRFGGYHYVLSLLSLFVGGISISVFLGRTIRLLFAVLTKK